MCPRLTWLHCLYLRVRGPGAPYNHIYAQYIQWVIDSRGTACAQVEAYPVMTEPILDAMRYLTPYGYDVLSFTVVHQLGASERDKLKADGLNISDWLQVSPPAHWVLVTLFTPHVAMQWEPLPVPKVGCRQEVPV